MTRLRWALTALFTGTAAICIATIATFTIVTDSRFRAAALDSELDRQVAGLSRAISYLDGRLRLESLDGDVLVEHTMSLSVWEDTGDGWRLRYSRTASDPAPDPQREQDLAHRVLRSRETEFADGAGLTGGPLRLAGAPVWHGDRVGAVVVVTGDPTPGWRAHTELVAGIGWGALGLLLLAGGAGYLLSAISMRPALQALEQQERFLTEAAHELRTPLATLRLLAEAGAADPARAGATAGQVVRLVDRMGHLVTGLLTRARVRNGSFPVELLPLRLDQLVEEVVTEHQGPVALETEPTVVRGDPVLLGQALHNLVDNAFRHGADPAGSARVWVRVAAGRVVVGDQGPGIAPEDRERVFDHSVTGAPDGTGIGLAIVRWVAELHHGSVRVLPGSPHGTVVELIVPEAPPSISGHRGSQSGQHGSALTKFSQSDCHRPCQ
ncbi:sensor histidine kinase [Goodfellowiella coeruleoviolacea]|uniref:sensor histidine kinase n=1 Tax=Goodfellowiella coeruleoviolacea TaxID=334858 RepID=UPI0020A51372|nr:HAMP domain-containing sensor histidine kinase [Goodfellowiella coeruleoviolacea]